jgi:hypothetical protein
MKSKTRKAAGKASLDPLVRCSEHDHDCERRVCYHATLHPPSASCFTRCDLRGRITKCDTPNAAGQTPAAHKETV